MKLVFLDALVFQQQILAQGEHRSFVLIRCLRTATANLQFPKQGNKRSLKSVLTVCG